MNLSLLYLYVILSNANWALLAKSRGHTKIMGPYHIIVENITGCLADDENRIDEEVYNNIYITNTVNEANHNIFGGQLTLVRAYKVVKAAYVVSMSKDEFFKPIFNRTSFSPCSDIMMGPMLMSVCQIKSVIKCEIDKGLFPIRFDLDYVAQKVIGKQFFYQRLQMRYAAYSSKGMTLCLNVVGKSVPTVPYQLEKNKVVKFNLSQQNYN